MMVGPEELKDVPTVPSDDGSDVLDEVDSEPTDYNGPVTELA
jgi:hypothetical protein